MNPTRHIELDIDIGADARDWSAIQAQEKLKPVETELRRIEELVGEIVGEMDYLRTREQKLRDTNESTNERVKWFAFGTMGMLVGLGAWQVVYLRAYFRCVSRLVYEVGEVRLIDFSQIETLDLVVRCMVSLFGIRLDQIVYASTSTSVVFTPALFQPHRAISYATWRLTFLCPALSGQHNNIAGNAMRR